MVRRIENAKGLAFEYFDNGIFSRVIWDHQISINLTSGNEGEFACSEVYLRIYDGETVSQIHPLRSSFTQRFGVFNLGLEWNGTSPAADFCYRMDMVSDALCWVTDISIEPNDKNAVWDLVFLEDRGLGAPDFLRGAELYASQYLDIRALFAEENTALCFRQNLAGAQAPWLIESLAEGVGGFVTDGHGFYGKNWETEGFPGGLWNPLSRDVEQGQFSVSGLASRRMKGGGEISRVSLFEKNHAVSSDSDFSLWHNALRKLPPKEVRRAESALQETSCDFTSLKNKIFNSEELKEPTLHQLFPQRILEEVLEDKPAAFFTPEYKHIVLKHKELNAPQSHSHIIRGGSEIEPTPDLPSLASFMNGCFIAHYAVGNSSMNSLISSPKFYVGLYSRSGVRIAFHNGNEWLQLGIPSVYEMDYFYSKWYYRINEDILTVCVEFSEVDKAFLKIESLHGENYKLRISLELEDGISGGAHRPIVQWINDSNALITRNPKSSAQYEPVRMYSDNLTRVQAGENSNSLYLEGTGSRLDFCLESSSVKGKNGKKPLFDKPETVELLGLADENLKLRLNAGSYWFSHNALIHFSVLYGAEQMKGSAWGVRDVLQGSLEYCFMSGQHETSSLILRVVLSQQRADTGDWPQWFMLQGFETIRDAHAHGDIVIWVLKALCEYTDRYGGYFLKEEQLPFYSADQQGFTEARPVAEHVEKLLDVIQKSLREEAYNFPGYGGGDWNDSLQPADEDMKENLVSVWSALLLAQYITEFSQLCKTYNLPYAKEVRSLEEKLRAGVQHLLNDYDYPPGFLRIDRERGGTFPLMHTGENQYPIRYRLLPLKRLIKSRLIGREQAERIQKIIGEHLTHKDGVRLLDYAIEYHGGETCFFRRLEQAAYFGREIGLMYTHAHLRYIEALLDLRMGEKAVEELEKILPMQIHQRIFNAQPRQANSYFASSDLVVPTRYELSGELNSDISRPMSAIGGWRIYSSGPGIMLSLLHGQLLGIRRMSGGKKLLLNPRLSGKFSDVRAKMAHPFMRDQTKKSTLDLEISLDETEDTGIVFSELRVKDVFLDGLPMPLEPIHDNYGYAGAAVPRFKDTQTSLKIVMSAGDGTV